MRHIADQTVFSIVDLGDQPLTPSVLVVQTIMGLVSVSVDEVEYDKQSVAGYRNNEVVIEFSAHQPWVLLDRSLVECYSKEEATEHDRKALEFRQQVNQGFNRTLGAGDQPVF